MADKIRTGKEMNRKGGKDARIELVETKKKRYRKAGNKNIS